MDDYDSIVLGWRVTKDRRHRHEHMLWRRTLVLAAVACVILTGAVAIVMGRGADSAAPQPEQPAQEATTILEEGGDASGQEGDATSSSDGAGTNVSAVRNAVTSVVEPYGTSVAVAYVPVDASMPGFDINGGVRMQSASMIKTLVLATLLQGSEDGSVSLDESYTVRRQDIVGGTGTIQSMGAGTRLTFGRLALLMISQSDNVATNVIIDRLGMDAINGEATSLGLAQTVLQRKMMDAQAQAAGRENYTCANDQATMLVAAARGELVSQDASSRAIDYLSAQEDTRGIPDGVPSGTVVAHKTGTLPKVRHDGGIVYGGQSYVLMVMTEGLDEDEANALIAKVLQVVWDQRK